MGRYFFVEINRHFGKWPFYKYRVPRSDFWRPNTFDETSEQIIFHSKIVNRKKTIDIVCATTIIPRRIYDKSYRNNAIKVSDSGKSHWTRRYPEQRLVHNITARSKTITLDPRNYVSTWILLFYDRKSVREFPEIRFIGDLNFTIKRLGYSAWFSTTKLQ